MLLGENAYEGNELLHRNTHTHIRIQIYTEMPHLSLRRMRTTHTLTHIHTLTHTNTSENVTEL